MGSIDYYFERTPTSALSSLGVDPNLVTPITFSWNFEAQYAIKPGLLFELGYVGQRSERTEAALVLDIPMLATAATPVNCAGPSGCITTNTAANAAQREPVLGFTPGGFSETANVASSSYHALQATLRKTLSKGLEFQAAYTWDKCLGDFLGTSTAASGQGGSVAYDRAPGQPSKGECGYDRPQRLVISYQYNLPRFRKVWGHYGQSTVGMGRCRCDHRAEREPDHVDGQPRRPGIRGPWNRQRVEHSRRQPLPGRDLWQHILERPHRISAHELLQYQRFLRAPDRGGRQWRRGRHWLR